MSKFKVENLKLVDNESHIKAKANLIYDDIIRIHGVTVVKNDEGTLFVNMPNYKGSDNKFYDIVHPTTSELRTEVNKLVKDAYNEAVKAKESAATEDDFLEQFE